MTYTLNIFACKCHIIQPIILKGFDALKRIYNFTDLLIPYINNFIYSSGIYLSSTNEIYNYFYTI